MEHFRVQNIFLICFFIFLLPDYILSEKIDIQLVEDQGICKEKQKNCVSFEQVSFYQSVWQGKTQEFWLNELKLKLKQSKAFKKKITLKESYEEGYPEKYGIFFKERVVSGDVVAEFNYKNILTSISTLVQFKKSSFYQLHKNIPQLNLNKKEHMAIRLALNILYHFYHINESPLKEDLRTYPQDINLYALNFNTYELNYIMISNEELKKQIDLIKEHILYDYSILMKAIKENWKDFHIEQFTNGLNEISLTDFVYTYSVIYQKSITDEVVEDGQKEEYLFIPYAFHFLKQGDINNIKDSHIKSHYDEKTGDYTVRIIAQDNFQKDDEFLTNFLINENYRLFAIKGVLQENNDRECFQIPYFDNKDQEQIIKKYNLQHLKCESISQNRIFNMYIVSILENLPEKDRLECLKHSEKFNNETEQHLIFSSIMNDCKHPKLEKFNPLKTALDYINNEYINKFEISYNKLIMYIQHREAKKYSTQRGRALQSYYQEQINILTKIRVQIVDYLKMNRQKQPKEKRNDYLEEL